MNTRDKIDRMYSRQGCVEVFWEELQAARKVNPRVTREAVWNELNDQFKTSKGLYRYIDYESFRQALQIESAAKKK